MVDDPEDLIVKGALSADTKVMTPAEFEEYRRDHPLPATGTR